MWARERCGVHTELFAILHGKMADVWQMPASFLTLTVLASQTNALDDLPTSPQLWISAGSCNGSTWTQIRLGPGAQISGPKMQIFPFQANDFLGRALGWGARRERE